MFTAFTVAVAREVLFAAPAGAMAVAVAVGLAEGKRTVRRSRKKNIYF